MVDPFVESTLLSRGSGGRVPPPGDTERSSPAPAGAAEPSIASARQSGSDLIWGFLRPGAARLAEPASGDAAASRDLGPDALGRRGTGGRSVQFTPATADPPARARARPAPARATRRPPRRR